MNPALLMYTKTSFLLNYEGYDIEDNHFRMRVERASQVSVLSNTTSFIPQPQPEVSAGFSAG